MFKFYRSVLAASAVALGLAACGDDVTVTNPPPPTAVVHSVVVVPNSQTVNVGQTNVTFVASVNADSGKATTVTWISTNPTVAAVGATTGIITALAPGQATIVATSTADNSKTGAGSLTVVALPPNILGFSVSPQNSQVAVGGSFQANPTVTLSPGAPAATIAWTTSNANIATVSSTGSITGVSAGTAIITAVATSGGQSAPATVGVTVGTGPTGVISFSVVPNAALLFAGQIQIATATVTMAPTFPALPVTWTSSAPTVASVVGSGTNGTIGTITANAQGTAIISATIGTAPNTLTQTVLITVGQAATISLNSVTAGATATTIPGCSGTTGAPVVLTDVNCQIDVNLNLTAGVQPLDSVTVWIQQGSSVKKLARQTYVSGGIPTIAASGIVTLSINSANFTKVRATGVAIVDIWNGPSTLIAQVWPHIGGSGSAVNCQIGAGNPDPTCSTLSMIFTNKDGWAGDITKCGNVINDATICPAANPAAGAGGFATDVGGSVANLGKTYWGGPGLTGEVAAELYAVVYNDNPNNPAGSSLNRCNNLLGNGTGCISTVTWSIGSTSIPAGHCPNVAQSATTAPATPIFFQVFGTSGAGLTNNCGGHENILTRRDNILIAGGAQDANANVYPTGPLIPNTVVFASTPDSFRLDWNSPNFISTPTIIGSEGYNWVNKNWFFNPGGTVVGDAGVGPLNSSWANFVSGGPSPVITNVLTTNGSTLAETNTNCAGVGCDGYSAFATATDLLGNAGNSGTVATFGVDKTSPLVRYSVGGAPSFFLNTAATQIASYGAGGTSATLDSTTYNAISGMYGVNVVTAGAQNLFLSAAAGTTDSFRIEGQDNRSGISRAIESTVRFAQGGATGAVTTINTTQTSVAAASFLPSTLDGWLPALAMHVTNGRAGGAPPVTPGYYTTTGYMIDKAGNVSGCPTAATISGPNGIGSVCTTAAPSTTANTNPAMGVGPAGTNANLFYRRTLALDPGQPQVTGVSPNNSYTGNAPAVFTLGSQNDLEVIDARLHINYPNVTQGDLAGTIPGGTLAGLVWSYSLSPAFMGPSDGVPGGTFSAGPASGAANWGYFSPIGIRFDGAVNALAGNGLGIVNPSVTPLTLDQFTASIQETCSGVGSPAAGVATGPTTATFCTGAANVGPFVGDPISTAAAPVGFPITTPAQPLYGKPSNVGVTVRDVFGSWIYNVTAGAATGVSTEFVSPILSATVVNPGSFAVTYFNPGGTQSCPAGGTVQPAGFQNCVFSGINFRSEPGGTAGTRSFRAVEKLSQTLPTFTRVELYGLNAAGQWVFVQRCTVPPTIIPNTGAQACVNGGGTVTGTDNGLERYWLYTFTSIPVSTPFFSEFRALGVSSAGFGLFSTIQP